MYTSKSSSILTTAIGFIAILAVLFSLPFAAFAQANYQCVINGDITIVLSEYADEVTVDNTLTTDVVLQNSSSYYFGGVNIGIGFYEVGETVPSYFGAYKLDALVEPGAKNTKPLSLDVSSLEKGTYSVKFVAFQGEGIDLLGALMLQGRELLTMVKEGDVSVVTTQSFTINGTDVASGGQTSVEERENINVVLKTENVSSGPVFDTPAFVSIVQGEIPLGTAVRAGVADEVRLIPGGFRNTAASDLLVQGGDYTVFGYLAAEGAAMPVVSARVTAGEAAGPDSWMYISKTAVSGLPLSGDDTVVSCVEYMGKNSDALQLYGPAGIAFSLMKGESVPFTATVTNEPGTPNKYFTITPEVSLTDFTLKAVLLEDRAQGSAVAGGQEQDMQDSPLSYTETQAVSGTYACAGTTCEGPVSGPVHSDVGGYEVQPYWFYIGVMLAAALLLYLMLRRLHPEDSGVPVDVADDELQ